METASHENWVAMDDDISSIVGDFCKVTSNYFKYKDDFKDMESEIRLLKSELSKARDLEKKHHQAMEDNKRLISEQRDTITNLLKLNGEIKMYKEELKFKDSHIKELQKEKECLIESLNKEKQKIENEFKVNRTNINNDLEVTRLRNEIEAIKCTYECRIQEISNNMDKIIKENEERINTITLDYDEQLNEAHQQLTKLMNELQLANDRYRKNTEIYEKKIQELQQQLTPQKSMEMKSSTMTGRSSLNNIRPHNLIGPYRLNSKPKPIVYNPLRVSIGDQSNFKKDFNLDLPKVEVKPTRRKLLNKDMEFFDQNAE